MLLFDGVVGLFFMALWIFCIVDVITTREGACRNLPKIAWLLIVLVLADVGSIAWLIAGRNWAGKGAVGAARRVPTRARSSATRNRSRSLRPAR